MDDEAILALVKRLARPHSSGGQVIERAAILAAGPNFPDVMTWITAHAGEPETAVTAAAHGGLHGGRLGDSGTGARVPLRFVLPAGALSDTDVHAG